MGKHAALVPTSEWQYKAQFKQRPKLTQQTRLPSNSTSSIMTIPVVETVLPLVEEDIDIPQPEGIQLAADDLPATPPLVEPEPLEPILEPTRPRSTRQRRPPSWYRDYVPTDAIAMPTILEPSVDKGGNNDTNPLLVFKAVRQSDPDTMYLWQAMRQADWAQFKQAMQERNQCSYH
jgi:hypothetical protein